MSVEQRYKKWFVTLPRVKKAEKITSQCYKQVPLQNCLLQQMVGEMDRLKEQPVENLYAL